MAKRMMTEKERIEKWLNDLKRNNEEFLSLASLDLGDGNSLTMCDGVASSGVHLYHCVEYIASVLGIEFEEDTEQDSDSIYLRFEYEGCKFYQIGRDDD